MRRFVLFLFVLFAFAVIGVWGWAVVDSRHRDSKGNDPAALTAMPVPATVSAFPETENKAPMPLRNPPSPYPVESGIDVPANAVVPVSQAVPGAMAIAGVLTSSEAENQEWAAMPSSPQVVASLREAFSTWRSAGQDDMATTSLRLAIDALPKKEILAAAATLLHVGSEQDRIDALWAVASAFGTTPGEEPLVRANIPEESDSADAADLDAEEREAEETHHVVALVAAGLEDSSEDVRDFAYETIRVLSPERSSVLYSQLLCSDSEASADLRQKLMEERDGDSDKESVDLFVTAMQSPDPTTAAAAKRNLESLSGRTFQSIDEVVEWLESEEQNPPDADSGDATPQ